MKGFITKTAASCCLSTGLITLVGCTGYRNTVDTCWLERYNMQARDSVNSMLDAQTAKGHVLDQTIWNWQFELVPDPKTKELFPSDRLSGAGQEALRSLSRRQPIPDFHVYLQNAQDIPFVAGVAPDKLLAQRNQLNEKRIQAIREFLATQAPLHGGDAYQVLVHDFTAPSIKAEWTGQAMEKRSEFFKSGELVPFKQPTVGQ